MAQDKIEKAKESLPVLKEELGEPFKQEAELEKKRTRREEVTKPAGAVEMDRQFRETVAA